MGLTLDLNLLRYCDPGEQSFKNEGEGSAQKLWRSLGSGDSDGP